MISSLRSITIAVALATAITLHAATTHYVTPNGAGAQDGTSWVNAFGNLQEAIDVSDSGDVIYLQSGVYTAGQPDTAELSQYLITDKDNLTISGGYAGSGNPGNRDGGSTILQRDPASTRRIINANGSSLTLNTITIDDGKLIVKGSQGAGLRLANCNVTLTNCIIRNNSMTATNAASYYGGGIYASSGALQIMAHQGLWGDFSLNSQRIHGESAEVKEDIGFKAFAVAVAAGLLYE